MEEFKKWVIAILVISSVTAAGYFFLHFLSTSKIFALIVLATLGLSGFIFLVKTFKEEVLD